MITGASSGIGRKTAKLFQSKNWKVAATMRTPEKETELARIADLELFRLDVTEPDSIRLAINNVIAKFGRIDAVVNNAGYGLFGAFEDATQAQIERQYATNVFGLMNVCREIIPYFRDQKRGVIVNVASIAGRVTFPASSLYNSTKWAVEGFSESLHYELAPHRIRVKIIEPGPIKTDFYDRSQDVSKADGSGGAYDEFVATAMRNMNAAGEGAPDGRVVAEKIWQAVTDQSSRLRYGVNTKGLLFLRSMLPDRLFFAFIRKIMLGK
jgi:NAD(P)-dependent dehydrogenase (short-subunit alcohol dehydrogenase family)